MHLAEDLYPHTSATWVFPNNGGYLFGGTHNKDYSILGLHWDLPLWGNYHLRAQFFVSKLMKMHAHPHRGLRPRGRQVIKLNVVKPPTGPRFKAVNGCALRTQLHEPQLCCFMTTITRHTVFYAPRASS